MPITICWDNPEKTIIRQEISGRWTSDEYVNSVMEMYDTMETVTQTVHILVDMARIENFPTRMLASAARFNARLPRNRGLTVGVQVPHYLVSIIRIALRLYPRLGRNLHFVSTVDEAYETIKKHTAEIRVTGTIATVIPDKLATAERLVTAKEDTLATVECDKLTTADQDTLATAERDTLAISEQDTLATAEHDKSNDLAV